ncbi:MAG: PIN domain-containing protein, partial [Candidatus Dormibacteraceae bacterium]
MRSSTNSTAPRSPRAGPRRRRLCRPLPGHRHRSGEGASRLTSPPVCDSTVLFDLLRSQPVAEEYVLGLSAAPNCSEVTRVEVLRGVRSAERSRVTRFFQGFPWIAVDARIADRAGTLGRQDGRTHPGISSVDLIIAATALELGAELATSSVK